MTATTYTPELGAAFCAAMASTTDCIATICKRKGMPSKATVFRWRSSIPEFATMYEAAKVEQLYCGIEECTEIADKAPPTPEGIQKARLRIDTRIKVAQRLKPKEFGDKITQELVGAGGGAIQVQSAASLTDDQLAAIAAGAKCS
jgi:hypothetical protein